MMRTARRPNSACRPDAPARRLVLQPTARRALSPCPPFPFRLAIKIVLSSNPAPSLPADAIDRAAATLGTDIPGLANRLGLAVGSVRHWKLHGMPPYARLAIAALITGLDPDPVIAGLAPRQRAAKDEDS